jgi:hypothetical protein
MGVLITSANTRPQRRVSRQPTGVDDAVEAAREVKKNRGRRLFSSGPEIDDFHQKLSGIADEIIEHGERVQHLREYVAERIREGSGYPAQARDADGKKLSAAESALAVLIEKRDGIEKKLRRLHVGDIGERIESLICDARLRAEKQRRLLPQIALNYSRLRRDLSGYVDAQRDLDKLFTDLGRERIKLQELGAEVPPVPADVQGLAHSADIERTIFDGLRSRDPSRYQIAVPERPAKFAKPKKKKASARVR